MSVLPQIGVRSVSLTNSLALAFALVSSTKAVDLWDFDRDGLNDIWQNAFDAQDLKPEDDEDGDGLTNAEECEHGSDPFNANSRFKVDSIERQGENIAFKFQGIPNQSYMLQISDDLLDWSDSETHVVTSQGAQDTLLAPDTSDKVRFMRLIVGADQDFDGLRDIDEFFLGYDASTSHTHHDFSAGDSAHFVRILSSNSNYTVNGRQVTGKLPTPEESSRFLHQATLGSTLSDIESVSQNGFAAWIEAQFSEDTGYTLPAMNWWIENADPVFNLHTRYAWWEQIMTSDDLLRQRLATALSEIYVISDQSLDGGAATSGISSFYDMLLDHSFGNWRDLLRDVSLHPAMGIYLSHLQNRKANPAENRFPDENYAREIMQLFSIGLFELNPDGTRKKDKNGDDIPTYDNEDITNFARVFTGFSYGAPWLNTNSLNDFKYAWGPYDVPMKMWEGEHDTDAKTLLNGTILPAFSEDAVRTGMDDFEAAIDNLYQHANSGPFICYRLIQRLIKSNPSPEYVRRVSQVFDDNGLGIKGDMKSVITAILLDPEARSMAALDDPHAGRLREPYIRWVRLIRSLGAAAENGEYLIPDWGHQSEIGQRWMSSPSVFNFFSPDYIPAGEMANAGLVGPEFQILTSTTAMATQNVYGGALNWSFGHWDPDRPEVQMHFDLEDEIALLNNEGVEAVIDHLDLLLTYGQLREDTKQVIRDAWEGRSNWFDDRISIAMIIRIIVLAPEFSIIR